VKLNETIVFVAGGFRPRDLDEPSHYKLESSARGLVNFWLLLNCLVSLYVNLNRSGFYSEEFEQIIGSSVPGVIASEHASPAAKRLALRLTFASYVMVPQLKSCDPQDGAWWVCFLHDERTVNGII